jgi:hypothetical protein
MEELKGDDLLQGMDTLQFYLRGTWLSLVGIGITCHSTTFSTWTATKSFHKLTA